MSVSEMSRAERDERIHCANIEGKATDPGKIPLEFLFFTHPGHILVILARVIVADGHDSKGHGVIFENLVLGRHYWLGRQMVRRTGSR